MSFALTTIHVLVCLFLLFTILLQQGRGGDIASAFGGGGGSQTAFGARGSATVLTKATTILGALFLVGAFVLGILGERGTSSAHQRRGSAGQRARAAGDARPVARRSAVDVLSPHAEVAELADAPA